MASPQGEQSMELKDHTQKGRNYVQIICLTVDCYPRYIGIVQQHILRIWTDKTTEHEKTITYD